MAVREGRWDCQYCGTKGNYGRDKACQNCGRSRPAGTKFYLPTKEEAAVLDENLLKLAKAGQDWVCEFCGSSNHADAVNCHYCGAARGTSPDQEVKEYGLGVTPDSGDMTFDEEPPASAKPVASQGKKTSAKLPLIIGGAVIGCLVICGLILAGFLIFGGSDVDSSVSGFEWDRTVEVEAYQTVTEEDWSVPSGGRVIGEQEKIHSYVQVFDHYENRQREIQVQVGVETYVCGQRDLGNGFFEDIECTNPIYETQTEYYEEPVYRQDPVYKPFYTYEIEKWNRVRTESDSGRDHNPRWPQLNLNEDEREGQKTEVYTVYFTDSEGEEYSLEVPLDRWQRYELGQSVVLKLDFSGNIDEVEP